MLLLVIGAFVLFGIGISVGYYLNSRNVSFVSLKQSFSSLFPSPPPPPPPLGPNEIHWADVLILINQCKVKNLIEGRYHSGTFYYMNDYPATDTKRIVDLPGFEVMKEAAGAVSSTCGQISVGRAIE